MIVDTRVPPVSEVASDVVREVAGSSVAVASGQVYEDLSHRSRRLTSETDANDLSSPTLKQQGAGLLTKRPAAGEDVVEDRDHLTSGAVGIRHLERLPELVLRHVTTLRRRETDHLGRVTCPDQGWGVRCWRPR